MQREILRKRILLCLICIAVWAIPLRANEVIVTGAAEIFNDNSNNANSQALQNALRQAVEQTVGDLIDSETLSRNFQIIKDEIFSLSRSLITRYEILEEGPTEDNRAYQVEIRAWIAGKKIRDKLTALRILRNETGSKRMMVIYRKQDPLALSRQFQTIPAQLGILNGIFRQAGFQLLDESEMNRVYQGHRGSRRDQSPYGKFDFPGFGSTSRDPGCYRNAVKPTRRGGRIIQYDTSGCSLERL